MSCIKIICHLSPGFSSESHFLFADKMEKSAVRKPAEQKTYARFVLAGSSLWGFCVDPHSFLRPGPRAGPAPHPRTRNDV